MDAYRTSNTQYMRQSSASRGDEPVPNTTEERIAYEQQQVTLVRLLKVLLVLFALLSLPFLWNLFRYGGLTNACGQKPSVGATLWAPFRWLFGWKDDGGCQTRTSTDFKTDDRFQIETTTQTTTCERGGTGERAVGAGLRAADGLGLDTLNPTGWKAEPEFAAQETDANGGKSGSFWDLFRFPSFGCSAYTDHLKALEDLKPSVGLFKSAMPGLDEVIRNYPRYANLVGAVAGTGEADLTEARGLLAQILDPNRQWKSADDSGWAAVARKPFEWLLDFKNVFGLQKLVADWKKSGANLLKKMAYLAGLRDRVEALPFDSRKCVDRQNEVDAQINDVNGRLSALLGDKTGLENQIQENGLRLGAFVSQRTAKEQEPLNVVRQLDLELQDLRFKTGNLPDLKADLEARGRAVRKAEDDLAELRRKADSDGGNSLDLQAKIDAAGLEAEGLRRGMEAAKVKLAMRRIKLQLANSNRQIKEYLMSLIRTNNGQPVDFQVLFSSSDNARQEIRRILREFINQSAGMQVEVSVSEAQLDDIIAKDQKEFEEIRKIYTELVHIINQYGDFALYISALAKEIADLEARLTADDRALNELLRKVREWRALMDGAGARRAAWTAEMGRLEQFIADSRRYIAEKEAEMQRWLDELEKVRDRKEVHVQAHKARSSETDRRVQRPNHPP